MNETANPFLVALLFILRCLVPLIVLFGISYFLRRMGLVVIDNPEPPDSERPDEDEDEDEDENSSLTEQKES
jgi:hypothetical protein